MRFVFCLLVLVACGGDDEAPADPAQSAFCLSVRKAWLSEKEAKEQYIRLSTDPKPQLVADHTRRMDALWVQSPECFR